MNKPLCVLAVAAAVLTGCASLPTPLSAAEARNTKPPREVVLAHLRALEAGDFDAALALVGPNFRLQMQGMPAFVSIGRENALDLHRARKQAFPDFRFNETLEDVGGNAVKVTVLLTGTHTGFLDYPISEVPKLAATGKSISLPSEFFTYFVVEDHIDGIFGEIPPGHGPPALKKQLGVE